MAIEFGSRKETFENFKVYETELAGRPFKVEMGKMCGLKHTACGNDDADISFHHFPKNIFRIIGKGNIIVEKRIVQIDRYHFYRCHSFLPLRVLYFRFKAFQFVCTLL